MVKDERTTVSQHAHLQANEHKGNCMRETNLGKTRKQILKYEFIIRREFI